MINLIDIKEADIAKELSGSSESSSLISLNITKSTSRFQSDSDHFKSEQDAINEVINEIEATTERSNPAVGQVNKKTDEEAKRTSYTGYIRYFDILTLAKHLFNYIVLFFYLWKNANSNIRSDNEATRKSSSPINNFLIILIILLLCCLLYIYVFLIFVKINSIEDELLHIQRSLLK